MNIQTIFIFFFIYSILGWIAEVIYCRIGEGKFTNRGFLNGPYCPIYGFGSVLIISFLEPFSNNAFLVFIFGIIITTILEYITSYIMEKIFNAKWWDYSHMKFNINGRVCLLNSIEFGILGLALIYLIHPEMCKLLSLVKSSYIIPINLILISTMFLDLLLTLNAMIDLRQRLNNLREITQAILDKEKQILENNYSIKKLKNLKQDLINKNKLLQKRLLNAFPDIDFKKIGDGLDEIRVKVNENRVRKAIKKQLKRK